MDSTRFKQQGGHANQGELVAGNKNFAAAGVTLGAYKVPASLVRQMGEPEKHNVTEADLERLPDDLQDTAQVTGGDFYFGKDPKSPQIGDTRVSYEVVNPGTFSIIAAQNGSTFEPYQTKAGDQINMVETGAVSAELMFKNAESTNTLFTWLARLGGFLFMAFGFMAIMRPLSVLGSVVPFIGNIIGMGTGFIAFLLAGVFSLLIIAIAWLAARPLLGILLLVGVIAGIIALRKAAAGSRAAAATA